MKTLRILSIALASLAASSAFAQVTIDQNKALAGGITPGDTAGFPITISQPGSYKLTSNLIVPAGTIGINIAAEGVTLDLNGFSVRAPGTCTRNSASLIVTCLHKDNTSTGIESWSTDTVVRNGSVRGFGGTGVYLRESGRIEDLQLSHNGGYGAALSVGHALGVDAELNASDGIRALAGWVTRSVARFNGNSGFTAMYVQESFAYGNKNYGVEANGVRGTVMRGNGGGTYGNGTKSMGGNLNESTPW